MVLLAHEAPGDGGACHAASPCSLFGPARRRPRCAYTSACMGMCAMPPPCLAHGSARGLHRRPPPPLSARGLHLAAQHTCCRTKASMGPCSRSGWYLAASGTVLDQWPASGTERCGSPGHAAQHEFGLGTEESALAEPSAGSCCRRQLLQHVSYSTSSLTNPTGWAA